MCLRSLLYDLIHCPPPALSFLLFCIYETREVSCFFTNGCWRNLADPRMHMQLTPPVSRLLRRPTKTSTCTKIPPRAVAFFFLVLMAFYTSMLCSPDVYDPCCTNYNLLIVDHYSSLPAGEARLACCGYLRLSSGVAIRNVSSSEEPLTLMYLIVRL